MNASMIRGMVAGSLMKLLLSGPVSVTWAGRSILHTVASGIRGKKPGRDRDEVRRDTLRGASLDTSRRIPKTFPVGNAACQDVTLCRSGIFPVVSLVQASGCSRGMASPAKKVQKKPIKSTSGGRNKGFDEDDDDALGILEVSELVENAATGERMPMSEYRQISAWTVLRVLEDKSTQEMRLSQVLEEAEELGLRAVMVAKTAKPPVVRLMNLGKVMRDKQKKAKESAKKQSTQTVKELRVGVNIGQHDLEVKVKHGREFLEKGHRLKLFTPLQGESFFNGQQKAMDRLQEVAIMLEDIARPESPPEMKGNIAGLFMRPVTPSEAKKLAKKEVPKITPVKVDDSSSTKGPDDAAEKPEGGSNVKSSGENTASTAAQQNNAARAKARRQGR